MVQLNPSVKREIRGWAVDSNISYWVVGGPWTWSNVNTCFLLAPVADAEGAPAFTTAADGGSTETELDDVGCTTERWKRAGIDVESWFVGGRIRTAANGQLIVYNSRDIAHRPT